jgi:hypothetical protein
MLNLTLNNKQKELCHKLHIETSIPIFLCKKCLEVHNWNYEKAKVNYENFNDDKFF